MSSYVQTQTAIGKLAGQGLVADCQPSIRESFEFQLRDARRNVARLEELLGLFDRNPDLQRAMELMGRY